MLEKDHKTKLADMLEEAFDWDESPEGFDYWAEVYQKLCNKAGIEPMRARTVKD